MATDRKRRRIHVVLPTELIEEIDALVGPRQRSRFIQEAVEEKLRQAPVDEEVRRQRPRAAIDEMASSLADVDIPGWETPEASAAWVRAQRK